MNSGGIIELAALLAVITVVALPPSILLFCAVAHRLGHLPSRGRFLLATLASIGALMVMALAAVAGMPGLAAAVWVVALLISATMLSDALLKAWAAVTQFPYSAADMQESWKNPMRIFSAWRDRAQRPTEIPRGDEMKLGAPTDEKYYSLLLVAACWMVVLLLSFTCGRMVSANYGADMFWIVFGLGVSLGWFVGWLSARLTAFILLRWRNPPNWGHVITLALGLVISLNIGWSIATLIGRQFAEVYPLVFIGVVASIAMGIGALVWHVTSDARRRDIWASRRESRPRK